MGRWRIEPLTSPDQIDDILAIEESSFTNPWTREMYRAELDNRGVSYCFLAKDEHDTVVGFCSFWRVLDELHINNLAVEPRRRRGGVATALLTHVLRQGVAMGATRATLEVRRSNATAQALYRKSLFEEVGVRRGYYTKDGEDAILMTATGLTESTLSERLQALRDRLTHSPA